MKIKDLFFTSLIATSALSSVQASQCHDFQDREITAPKTNATSFQQKKSLDLPASSNSSSEDSEDKKRINGNLPHDTDHSKGSAKDKPKSNYLLYNPYEDVNEAEMKVATTLAAINKEQESLKSSFLLQYDPNLWIFYETIKLVMQLGYVNNDMRRAVSYIETTFLNLNDAYHDYFINNSRYGIIEPVNSGALLWPEDLLYAVVEDTGLATEVVENIFSNSYGWDF